jgi:hypothetical protein
MNYNISHDFTENKAVTIEINAPSNRLDNPMPVIHLDECIKSKEDKFKFMFMRYKKLILITTKAMKRPKIEFTDFQRILKYM